MDLGFGGFLEKFEVHFGRSWTKALLILIALTVATLCGSVIWAYVLYPIAQLIPDPNPKSGPWYAFGKLVVVVALFLTLVNQLLQLFDNYLRRRITKRVRDKLKEAHEILQKAEGNNLEAQKFNAEALADVAKAKDYVVAAEMAMERLFAYALESGMLTQADVDELRSLMEPSDPAGSA